MSELQTQVLRVARGGGGGGGGRRGQAGRGGAEDDVGGGRSRARWRARFCGLLGSRWFRSGWQRGGFRPPTPDR
eukprot:1307882-Pyramimonas_sp.AAC.1